MSWASPSRNARRGLHDRVPHGRTLRLHHGSTDGGAEISNDEGLPGGHFEGDGAGEVDGGLCEVFEAEEKMTELQKHLDHLKKMAITAFEKHVLVEQHVSDIGGNRWFIARPHKDGNGYDGIYATEVIALRNGRLFVGGDIDDCVFAYGDKDPLERLRWIGCCEDLDYYVKQKATIGLGDGGKLTEEYVPSVARSQLEEVLRDAEKENTKEEYLEYLREAKDHVDEHDDLMQFVHEHLSEYELYYLGGCCSARVVFAWAAVRRLCELLGLRENQDKTDGSTT